VVGEAADGAEGVELAAALRPDVVLMDWRMPRLDGVQATARIRQQLPEVQVVMFTSLEGAGIGAAAREAGGERLMAKGGSPLRSAQPCKLPHRQPKEAEANRRLGQDRHLIAPERRWRRPHQPGKRAGK
jgi:CheY-like chemotaxis protein